MRFRSVGPAESITLRPRRNRSSVNEPWWLIRLKAHPIRTLIGAAFGFGGLLLMTFFAQLRDLPELDLASSASLLWAVALLGGLLVAVLIGLPLLPAMYARQGESAWRKRPVHVLSLAIPSLTFVLGTCILTGVGVSHWDQGSSIAAIAGLSWIAIDSRWYHLSKENPR